MESISLVSRVGQPMLSALDLARDVEAGTITPRDVVDRCAQAIAHHEAEIGAFVALDVEAARRDAEVPGLRLTPLRGLPVGIKDIFDTADFPTQYGSPIYAGHRPKADAALVALVRRAGGLVLGKTVTTELASLQPAATRNPRNPAHTPGGSSSGSAAAVASGMLPIALGSQTGGSVIRPAAFCGIAGYKPSFRLMPTVGMKCFSWSLDTAGVLAAGVADAAFAAAAITGRDLRIDQRAPAPRPRLRWCAPICGRRRAQTCRPRSSAPRAPPKPPARRSGSSAAAGFRGRHAGACHHPGPRSLSGARL